ncbi:protein RIK isoform X2 [Rhododendron vialii]|uniref:protein RIK isoform X2 n=1 Tax=Rhododendron vialii TaxID=182163 RepID=UPI00265F2C15|nr:protein RIK isoform X2 [Rhododendron vialii]
MTEDNCARVSSADAEQSATKQRKKRKWDQPAESLVVAGVAVPGILPLGNMGSLAAITLPGITSASGALLTNTLTSSSATTPPLIQPHATAVLQKMNQKKIQDELIAREIVINDADSAVRYMLTKRQTQEEIQKCTGAIVITRGKYHPPNAPPDGEKPLYLHISAGAHLETTVERIKAVDRAAAMVEELLKQGSISNGGKATILLSTSVYLGFEADPSLNVAARIRGPNDQYVNHIVNETGATVLLRGHGSGSSESGFGEEGQQPLHLFLSSNNPKSLESAKLLAENLLDTISIEFGASRKAYGAVPPPQQLWNGVQSGIEVKVNNSSAVSLTSSAVNSAAIPPISSATHPVYNTTLLQGTMSSGHLQPHTVSYPQLSSTAGTSYSGYGGIYPQATPLQQVALALRQSPSTVNPLVSPASTAANSMESLPSEKEKRASQRRKFQESPAALKGRANPHQVFSLTLYEAYRPILDLCCTISMFHRAYVMVAAWDWCILLLRNSPVADSRIYVSDFKLFVACKPSTRTPIFLFFSFLFPRNCRSSNEDMSC